jgi:WD40 repeat protein
VFEFGHNGTISSLDFHPLGGFFCLSDTDDVIKVWYLNRRIMINEFKVSLPVLIFSYSQVTKLIQRLI